MKKEMDGSVKGEAKVTVAVTTDYKLVKIVSH